MDPNHIEKALQLINLRRYDSAVSVLLKNLSETTGGYSYYLLAFSYLQLDDLPRTKRSIDLGLKKDPDYPELHGLLAQYYEEKGQPGKALKALETALELDPENGSLLAALTRLHLNNNRTNAAEKVLKTAFALYPNMAELFALKAYIHAARAEDKAAFNAVNKALQLEPNNETYLALRARLRLDVNPQEAEENAIAALKQDPTDEYSRSTLLEVYKNKNWLLRFFVGNSFNRYLIEWSVGRVILMILFWKGVLIWGGFAVLYLIVTWYGGVLYNSVIRLHQRYQLLLSKNDIHQSNYFLALNGTILVIALMLRFGIGPHEVMLSLLFLTIISLFIGISYFEIETQHGKTTFAGFCVLAGALLGIAFTGGSFTFIAVAIIVLLLYAFMFSLRVIAY
ncbi:MAG: tetratricopeptide repeat protein [Bacteroidota bacterium]